MLIMANLYFLSLLYTSELLKPCASLLYYFPSFFFPSLKESTAHGHLRVFKLFIYVEI